MKKTSLVNLIVVIGLLVLCVMTLTAIYATTSESSTVLLLNENFNVLDESKWERQTSNCKEEGDQFHYLRTGGENSYVDDNIVQIHPISNTEEIIRKKRAGSKKCNSCLNTDLSDGICVVLLYSTNFRTKNAFDVQHGRIEIRAKLPTGDLIKSTVSIIPNNTESGDTKGFNLIETKGEEVKNGSADVKLSFDLGFNKTTIERTITADEFHTYEIEWNRDKISFKIDNREIQNYVHGLSYNSTERSDNTTYFNQPFYLNVGVDVGKKNFQNEGLPGEHKRSLIVLADQQKNESTNENILKLDYIRLFKILN